MCSKKPYDPENLNLWNFGVVSFALLCSYPDFRLPACCFLQNSIMNVHNSCFLLAVSLFAQMFLSNMCVPTSASYCFEKP